MKNASPERARGASQLMAGAILTPSTKLGTQAKPYSVSWVSSPFMQSSSRFRTLVPDQKSLAVSQLVALSAWALLQGHWATWIDGFVSDLRQTIRRRPSVATFVMVLYKLYLP